MKKKTDYCLLIAANSCQRQSGFTFIELLVVITIMGLLIALGVASYNNFNDRQTLVTTVEKIQTDLRLAQARAVANKAPISGCTVFNGYRATFEANSYTIAALCGALDTNPTVVNFPANLIMTTPTVSTNMIFRPRTGGTSLAADLILIYQYSVGAGATASLTITPQGEIRTSL